MGEPITEKNYPVQNIWLFKEVLVVLIALPLALVITLFTGETAFILSSVLSVVLYLPPVIGIAVVFNLLQRANFHYSIEDNFVVLHQGIISKQNRNVPYGRIQGIFVNQGIFDRIFGLASLTFEDFSQGGKSMMDAGGYIRGRKKRYETIGFAGNKIHIPGLKKDDAETLKTIILQKIKENPLDDNQSGL